MKKFTQLMAVFAALVLALACFASCKNDSDGSGSSAVSTWKTSEFGGITIYIYEDNTAKISRTGYDSVSAKITSGDINAETGTVTIQATSSSNGWINKGEEFTATKKSANQFIITAGKYSYGTYTKQ